MDAAELMEWVAYFKTTDEKTKQELQQKILQEQSQEANTKLLRAFFDTITIKSKARGVKRRIKDKDNSRQ